MWALHACVCTVLLGSLRGEALPRAPQESPAPSSVSLTVSGGVSLGAYEAGFLYYAASSSQGARAVNLQLVTGASAGGLNALLAVLATCGVDSAVPGQSLFWSTWIPVGFDQLFVPASTTALGIFSREWLARGAGDIEKAWEHGLATSCDVVLGVSTTRMEPRVLHAAGGRLDLPRIEEKFAIRIQGQGLGRPPRATNYTTPDGPRMELMLVTDEHGHIAFSRLRDLLFASMAFPIAFPPQPLDTCVPGDTATANICLAKEARTDLFIDGGVFDNTPLRLAVGLARDGLRETSDGRLEWSASPRHETRSTPSTIAFAFIDPDATEYPVPPSAPARAQEDSLPATLSALLAAFVDTARSKELALLLEEEPEIARRLALPRRHFPAASAPLFAFLGFFETEFRVFDFYLGMYDARRMLEDAFGSDGSLFPRSHALPDDSIGGWRPFACMLAVYDSTPDAERACHGEDLRDFRALLQVSLDELYSACAAVGQREQPSPWRNAHCDRAMAGQPPPHVPGLSPRQWPEWKRSGKETELDYAMRLLGAYGFRFEDLGVPPGRGDLAITHIRRTLGRALNRLAEVQPGPAKATVRFAGKVAADSISYEPQQVVLHVTVGPTQSEVGLSLGLSRLALPMGLRLASAVDFRGLEDIFSAASSDRFGIEVVTGLEFQPQSEQSILAQSRLGVRGGWLFSSNDHYATQACEERGARSVTACSRPVLQAFVGLTFLERFRIQVVGEWYPGSTTRKSLWAVAPGIGLELGL
ncbi:patatin-like phospholipase family protein [Myxococcus stipitatus]|uniref:patatin-like phospholipase family protein n=1 Tax=Myxococcus stipitatus TaxID=83455 RepID=UPI001F3B4C36|nr:patatin-like phospholipase family protein [Myxococcus stipitatus]MCE9669814.1 patatin-like phospholipase family protein [Myxococcus stipitatus]